MLFVLSMPLQMLSACVASDDHPPTQPFVGPSGGNPSANTVSAAQGRAMTIATPSDIADSKQTWRINFSSVFATKDEFLPAKQEINRMPKGPKGEKRPADANQRAVTVARIATA